MLKTIITKRVLSFLSEKITKVAVEKLLQFLKNIGKIVDYDVSENDGIMTVTVKTKI